MEKLLLSKSKTGFILKTAPGVLDNMKLFANETFVALESTSPGIWELSFATIASILRPNVEDRVFIYYDNELQISSKDFEIFSEPDGMMEFFHNQRLFLYFSLDGFLRVISNQFPSSKAYFKSAEIYSIFSSNSDILTLSLKVNTTIFKAEEVDLVITNRKDRLEWTSPTKIERLTKIERNNYQINSIIKLNPSEVFPKLIKNNNYLDYNMDIFDFSIRIKISEQDLTNFKFRLVGPTILPNSMWFNNNENRMLAITWYRTTHGYISNRISFISNEGYEVMKNLSVVSHASIPKKPIVLIIEYPYKAQDNGYYFFKYLMENQSQVEPFYIITEDSPDLPHLNKYKSNVIFYKSIRHIQLFNEAAIIAHTHSPNYSLPIYTNKMIDQLGNIKKLFLQHGILGFRNMEPLYGRNSNPNLIDKFLVSSPREFRIVRDDLFYSEKEISITGLARFDNLLKGNSKYKRWKLRKALLIMPSWRSGQENLTDEEFQKTHFYKAFSSLITNLEFEKLVFDYNLTVDFYLHNNFQKYSHLFRSKFVNILSGNEITVQQLLKSHGVLITDFSSVGFDFAIQRRSVLYYQFEDETSNQNALPYANSILPGPIISTEPDLLTAIKLKIVNNKLERKYLKQMKENIYGYSDSNACKRILKQLLSLIEDQS